jgi:uracil-DNA glycosylase family 4
MFTGDRSGDFLVDGLHEHGFANQATSRHRDDGLRLTGAWLTAPVKCAPPANRPLTEERDRCLPFLKEELSLLVSARVYLALGAYAFEALRRLPDFRPPLTGQRFAHGAEHSLAGGRKALLCSYHPSQRNVFTGKLTREMFSAVLRRAREIAYG